MSMNVGIIGCGLMGQQRARSLALMPQKPKVVVVYDPDPGRASELAGKLDCHAAASLAELLAMPGFEVAIVAVPHWIAKDTAIAALRAGKHVLCEKPLGLTTEDAREVVSAAESNHRMLTPGFNYRFYPGFQAAARALEAGAVGKLTHIRAELGHGARPGYEKEWKTSKALCGGGALLDPGVHFIDLIRFYAGEIRSGSANLVRSFWDIDVEDNAFVHFQTESGVHVELHISITEWRSRSALDLFGRDGCIQVRGRSGFYGPQVMRIKKRWDWIEPAQPEQKVEFPPDDLSFAGEMSAFWDRLEGKAAPDLATAQDGVRALEIVENLYRACPVNAELQEWSVLSASRV
jgi:predicted dehydrogenase